MAKQIVTASAKKAGQKRHVREMHIQPSKNGGAAIMSHFHPTKPAGGPDDMAVLATTPEPEMHTFGSPDEAGAHVTSMLKTGMPVSPDDSGD